MVIRYVPNKFETKEEWLPGGTKRIAEIDNSHSTSLRDAGLHHGVGETEMLSGWLQIAFNFTPIARHSKYYR